LITAELGGRTDGGAIDVLIRVEAIGFVICANESMRRRLSPYAVLGSSFWLRAIAVSVAFCVGG